MQETWRGKLAYPGVFVILCFTVQSLLPGTAWAVQQHGGAEGLVSHQIGHLLFIIGMFYLLYRLQVASPTGGGWPHFKLFVWLIICWKRKLKI